MATDHPNGTTPEDPANLIPQHSVLELEEYLDMLSAVGNRTRFEIVYRLVHGGSMSPTELVDRLDIDDSTLHYHLNQLLDAGLVQKRTRTDRGQEGLYTYYRPTVFGDVVLTDGILDLIRGEHEFEQLYGSE